MSHSHCGDEDHSHGDHGHGHSHSHSPPPESIPGDSLFNQIDRDRVRCLNERVHGMAQGIIKPWDKRLDTQDVLESDTDEQMIVFVPFTGVVKLKSILIRAPPDISSPQTVKVFINREDVDFSIASDLPATATITMIPPFYGGQQSEVPEYPVKRVHFNNVRNITLYIEDNYSDGEEDVSRLWYIGFKGEWTELKDTPVVAVYEAQANPADHEKIHDMLGARHSLGH